MLKRHTRAWLLQLPLLPLGLFAGASWAQQAAPAVLSNLEQASLSSPRAGTTLPLPSAGPVLVPDDFARVPLTAGALLDLRVYRVPEMSGTLRVDDAGNVHVPVLGKVAVAGRTPAALQAEIASRLEQEGLLVQPQVNIDVLQYAVESTTVSGEVQMPGRISLQAPKPLPAVLALAGGETIAAGVDIEIQHRASGGQTPAPPEHVRYQRERGPGSVANVLVSPGDTVFVHRAGIVYVLGAVTRPGGYLMVDGGTLDLSQAIALAQGTTLLASTKKVWIVRRADEKVTEIPVDYTRVAKGKEPAPTLFPEDVVYVAVSNLKATLINGSSVLSAATAAAIYAGSGH